MAALPVPGRRHRDDRADGPGGPGGSGGPGGPGGRGVRAVRVPRVGLSARVDVRAVWVTLVMSALAFVVFAWSLSVGDYPVPLGDVVATLVGRGRGGSDYIVGTLRLPRGLTALLVGAGFGMSGAILQRLTRNPLAGPDIIGVNAGAAVVAVSLIVLAGVSGQSITAGALAGGAVTSLVIYLLAYRNGVTGYRLVLVGIGVTAALTSITQYMLIRAEIYQAQRAVVWLTGSLYNRGWEHVRPVAVCLAVVVPVALILSRQMRTLDLGDDAARGLGTRVEAVRGGLLLCAAALAAVCTAAAGPVAFVGLVSPQIARRLIGGPSAGLLPAAACGALLLVSADLVARRVFAPVELPVGIVTAILGAPFLLYLLVRSGRSVTA